MIRIFDLLSTGRQTARFTMRLAFLTLISSILMMGCTNDPDEIGIGIMPDDERLTVLFSDTTTVLVHSVFADSIKTDKTARVMLGSYTDPVFGVSSVNVATQVTFSTVTVNYGQNPVLDSIVLSLDYMAIPTPSGQSIKAYGDTMTVQTFRVFEIDEDIYFDTAYYSNYDLLLKAEELASKSLSFRPSDSIMVDTIKTKPQLRIRLSDEFGNNILNAPEDALESADGFRDFMKGLFIKSEPVASGGAIAFFDILASTSRLTIYYHNDEGDRLSYPFFINDQIARFMTFTHDYDQGDAAFVAQLNGDTALGSEKFYLQSLGGVEAVVSFPYLQDWFNDQTIIINEAKLIFSNADTESDFAPPSELFFFVLRDDGTIGFLEEQFEGEAYFGGRYNSGNGQYFFRITQHLQQIMTGEKQNTPFKMGITGASLSPNRVILVGSAPGAAEWQDKRVKLNLIYTKL